MPLTPVSVTVEALGPNPGGLEQLRLYVEGFGIAPLSEYGVGCTAGPSLEAQIIGAPLYCTQKRVLPISMVVVDPESGIEHDDFKPNFQVHADFNFEAVGLGYYSWPLPRCFSSFSVDAKDTAELPEGPVELIFEISVKPGYTIAEVVSDLETHGYIASDFSVAFNGITYLLWTGTPFMTNIDTVVSP